jgi:hypothetical protein
VERNRKAGQNPPRVVAPTEEEEEYLLNKNINNTLRKTQNFLNRNFIVLFPKLTNK